MAKKLVAVLTAPSPYYNLNIRPVDSSSWGASDEDVLATTDEDVKGFEHVQREMYDKNAELYQTRLASFNEAFATLREVYKGDSITWGKMSKYLDKSKPQPDFQRDVRLQGFLTRRKTLLATKIKEAFEIERKKAQDELLGKAVAFLLERGEVLGVSFQIEEAIAKAEDIFYHARLDAQQKVDEVVDFDECDGCSTWHTKSNRCSCGNRRVDWVMSEGFSFSNPEGSYFRPEAW